MDIHKCIYNHIYIYMLTVIHLYIYIYVHRWIYRWMNCMKWMNHFTTGMVDLVDQQPTSGLLCWCLGRFQGTVMPDFFDPCNGEMAKKPPAFLRWSQQPPATTSLKFRHDLGKPWALEPMSQLRQDAVLEMVCYNCSICFNEFTKNSLRIHSEFTQNSLELRIVRGALSSLQCSALVCEDTCFGHRCRWSEGLEMSP